MRTSGLAYLSLFVKDLPASKRFYVDLLGLKLLEDEAWGAALQAGSVQIMLHPRENADEQHVELVFDVLDLDEAMSEARASGLEILEEPEKREWGDRDGAVADPDGNRIYLRERPGA